MAQNTGNVIIYSQFGQPSTNVSGNTCNDSYMIMSVPYAASPGNGTAAYFSSNANSSLRFQVTPQAIAQLNLRQIPYQSGGYHVGQGFVYLMPFILIQESIMKFPSIPTAKRKFPFTS